MYVIKTIIMCELQAPDLSFYIGILAGFLAIGTPIYQYFEKPVEDRTFIKNGSQFIVALAGVLAITITIIQWRDKRDEDYKHCLSEQIAAKDKRKADSLQIEIYKIGKKNSDDLLLASNELHEADKEIIKLNKDVSNFISGEESLPILEIVRSNVLIRFTTTAPELINELSFTLKNSSKYPIYNLNCNLKAAYNEYGLSNQAIDALAKGDTSLYSIILKKIGNNTVHANKAIGTINKKEEYVLYEESFSKNMKENDLYERTYRIDLKWNGGSLIYIINLHMYEWLKGLVKNEVTISYNGKKITDTNRFIKIKYSNEKTMKDLYEGIFKQNKKNTF